MAARASYIAGFAGTATMLAEEQFGIPTFGTMAHSFVEAYETESAAFESFARSRPQGLTLLIDTYDTENVARKVVTLAPRLAALGIKIRAVRLDSGDLIALSKAVRTILDAGGLADVTIFASGGLDEDYIAELVQAGAPIDGFGVGTSLTTSSDVPALDCAYKLQEYAGLARRKRSAGKATWPGRKQVWRHYGQDGRMAGDVLSLESDTHSGEPLIELVMKNGRRVGPHLSLAEIRRERDFERVFLAGLAFDFCVRYSAEDACREGFQAIVIEDACRGIDVDGSMAATREMFKSLWIRCVPANAIAG
jgi:nicotinate phosphoribosyltransferase